MYLIGFALIGISKQSRSDPNNTLRDEFAEWQKKRRKKAKAKRGGKFIKRITDEGIEGICRIGFTQGGMELYISEDRSETIPHFFAEDPDTGKEVHIRMDRPDYLPDEIARRFNEAERRDLIAFFAQPVPEWMAIDGFVSYWDAAVCFWKLAYPNASAPDLPMPDYTRLPIEGE